MKSLKIVDDLHRVPPLWWVGLVAVGGVLFLSWHMHGHDIDDTDWTDPQQPPDSLALPIGPGMSGAPMDAGQPFRSRSYCRSLKDSRASLIGEF